MMKRTAGIIHLRSVASLVSLTVLGAALLFSAGRKEANDQPGVFRAGAVVIDVTPKKFPVLVNGGMVSRTASEVTSPLKARGLAFADGEEKLVIVVVDSCMMGRPLLDEAKKIASEKTGIPVDHMLISATHTHTAGSCFGALGTDADPDYSLYLKGKIVETIVAAEAALQPAQVGYGTIDAPEYTAVRRWIRRPDRIIEDPFGNLTVRANMHSGRDLDNVTGESGPEDPELSLISVRTLEGEPMAVLANFSMHYFSGEKPISADYFGVFCEGLKAKLAPESSFVGIMSHGCSGDIWRRDYTKPDKKVTITEYSSGMVDLALKALESVEYRSDVSLTMAEMRIPLKYRVPDKQLLEWSQKIVDSMGDRLPKTKQEIYAREQIFLHEMQETEVVTQAIRIGDIAIATTPTETYAITGLKIKAQSPLRKTMVFDLANGADGYIPPPEQHLFGGYNTWAARSAGLEVMAEPKITAACLNLLEKVSGKPRRKPVSSRGSGAKAIAALKPLAWFRMDEFNGPAAIDSSGKRNHGTYEPAVTYYLEGPYSGSFCLDGELNRAAMFAGGRLRVRPPELGKDWSLSLWFWNGMPNDGREVSGWLVSTGDDGGLSANSVHLGVGGNSGHTGKLILQIGSEPDSLVSGETVTPRWGWQHVVLVKKGNAISVYLNGGLELMAAEARVGDFEELFLGGRSDNSANWEGRLDEVALFDRALTAAEVVKLSAE